MLKFIAVLVVLIGGVYGLVNATSAASARPHDLDPWFGIVLSVGLIIAAAWFGRPKPRTNT